MQVCVFAYGQTGSGKTFTIIGKENDSAGIIPRSLTSVFKRTGELMSQGWNYTFQVCNLKYQLVLYCYQCVLWKFAYCAGSCDGNLWQANKWFDLLGAEDKSFHKDDIKHGSDATSVEGLTYISVSDSESATFFLKEAIQKR